MPPEPIVNPSLTDEDVRMTAVERLMPLLPEPVEGYRVDSEMLFDALVYAAADQTSLHDACGALVDNADDNTLREYLNDTFPADSA